MAKLTMLKGLPASGKSTLSRELVGNGKSCIRINRDDLRAMMYGKYSSWSGKKEEIVIKAEKAMASSALTSGYNVIIDDTNLSYRHKDMWSNIANTVDAKFEVVEVNTDIDSCVFRDRMRGNERVGRAVIENMALKYNFLIPLSPNRSKITIWDVDGTLIDISHRCGRDENGKILHPTALKHLAYQDKVYKPIAKWFKQAQNTTTAFIVSGRGTDEGIFTEDMLRTAGVVPDRMFMRNSGDNRADVIVKKEILDRILFVYGVDCIEFVVDDCPSVVNMWRSNGLKVYPVNQQSWEGRECLSQPETLS
jgi:predicted kinase